MAQLGDTSPPSILADLPEELSLAIIEELDMASIFALSQTCRHSQRLANPADESRRDKLQDFLLEVQSFPRWSDGLACFSCTKVLPRDSFANPSGAQSGTTARMASRPNNSAHGLRTMMMSARRRFWCDGQCLNAGSGSGVNGSSGETQAKCYAD